MYLKNILTHIAKGSKLVIVYLLTVIIAGSILTYLSINNISNFEELTDKRITEEEKTIIENYRLQFQSTLEDLVESLTKSIQIDSLSSNEIDLQIENKLVNDYLIMNILNKQHEYIENKETYPLAKTFMSGVFMWMFLALGITAVTAWLFASSQELITLLYKPEGGMSITGWIVMLAPLGLVLWMSARFQRMSASTMVLIFILFSVLLGASLSSIFLIYTGASIVKTFVITSGMFGTMAVVGYTTKTDLTKFGSLMFMGLIGIIIASVVNMFMRSGTMDYIISFIGVLVFTGLTAYDVQKLKRIGSKVELGSEGTRKLTIMGALTLYLDFINLFLFLLRFFGNRK